MRVVTRKQHFLAAQMAPLQAGKRVFRPEQLEDLVALLALNPALCAFVDSLEVSLRSAFPAAALRKALHSLCNLTDLILVVPTLRSPAALRGIHLPNLQYFRTDMPHQAITEFLVAHPNLTDLDLLGMPRHSFGRCPLQMVDLTNLKCLSGSAMCVPQIAPSGLARLSIHLGSSTFGGGLALRAISTPFSRLYQLTIDIRDNDDDILHSIAYVCPGLRKLKLIEQGPRTIGRSLRRRAWSDAPLWAKALSKLQELEELLIRTPAALVRRPADLALERQVILSWVNGGRRMSRRTHERPHPTLYHIGIWYSAGMFGGGCVTHWSKPTGVWERQVCIVEPTADQLFI